MDTTVIDYLTQERDQAAEILSHLKEREQDLYLELEQNELDQEFQRGYLTGVDAALSRFSLED